MYKGENLVNFKLQTVAKHREKLLGLGVAFGFGALVGIGITRYISRRTYLQSRSLTTNSTTEIRRRTSPNPNDPDIMEEIQPTPELDDEKSENLALFYSQTGEEDSQKSLQILRENNWNVDAAVKAYKDSISRANGGNRGWISSIWNFGWNFVSSFFPAPTDTEPGALASRFITELERQYGNLHPNFIQGSFLQAAQQAKREFKFLVVYIHSSMHHETASFCSETLCTEVISEFLNENFLIWGANINNAEGYKTSNVLGASSYPFIAVVTHNTIGGMTILDRIEGNIQAEALMLRLSIVLENHGPSLLQARFENEERETNRRIREEQDDAYNQALREDQERQRRVQEAERKEREEREAAEREEQQQKRKAEEKQKRKERLRASLPSEPESGDGASNLVVRLTDGSRLQRRFRKTDALKVVFDYVECNQDYDGDFDLVTNFPRKVFSDRSLNLEEAGLYPHASLFVQEK